MPPVARRVLVLVVVGLVGGVAALAALTFLPPTKADLGPGTVSLQARCCFGDDTVVQVPPVGSISADTHRRSVQIEATIDEVDVERLQALGGADDPEDELVAQIEHDLPGLLRRFALRSALMGIAAGVVVGLLVPGRRWQTALVGGVGGLLAVGVVVVLVGTSYDEQAFAEPRFEGTLSEAPRVIEAAGRYVEDFDDVESRVEVLGAQIGQLYETSVTDSLRAPDADEVRVLHISDVHLNPVGIEVAEDLATRFGVDAVLDTGDLTTFGLPAEGRFAEELDFDVPYLFVPGNHDSEENREVLAEADGVTLLDGEVAAVAGLTILGVGDPTFTAENDVDDAEAAAALEEQAGEVADLVAEEQPDVLAVHNLLQAADVGGEVPLVVGGHNHRRSSREDDGTLLLTVGSTGATGVGSFTVEQDHPYEAEVLRFVDGELIGVDYLTLSGVQGEFTIDRTLYP
jgi:predicted phosphodiesterase